MRRRDNKSNNFLIAIICLLILAGILALATASIPFSLKSGLNPSYYLFHQLGLGLLPGIILGFIAYKTPINILKKYSFLVLIFALVLMVLVFIPFLSKSEGGATRWLDLKFFSFQPSEFLKLACIVYFSAFLTSNKVKNKASTFIIILGIIGLILFKQSNLSTFVIIASICSAIFFSAKTSIKSILGIAALGLISIALFATLAHYRMTRISVFLHPEKADISSTGYHINQSLIGVGSGGLFGSGLGLSSQKLGFVPETISDSIFTIFAEETGFIGCSFLVILFLLFAWVCFSLAKRQKDQFSKLIVVGIGFWITMQALANIAAMTGLGPLTGIPLPFISYGGSHLMMELMACGLLLQIASETD